jgi:hypothetical protein
MRVRLSLEERKRRLRERMKLLTANMTTYGYALLGSAMIDPAIKTAGLKPLNFIMITAALALHVFAGYLVPEGEKP